MYVCMCVQSCATLQSVRLENNYVDYGSSGFWMTAANSSASGHAQTRNHRNDRNLLNLLNLLNMLAPVLSTSHPSNALLAMPSSPGSNALVLYTQVLPEGTTVLEFLEYEKGRYVCAGRA